MIWLLDTNTLAYALNGVPAVRARLNAVGEGDRVVTSLLVYGELLYGVEKSTRRERNLQHLEHELTNIEILAPTPSTARVFARLKADLRRRGIAKADIDLWIASTAVDAGATLVTNDAALLDGSIPGLQAQNWAP